MGYSWGKHNQISHKLIGFECQEAFLGLIRKYKATKACTKIYQCEDYIGIKKREGNYNLGDTFFLQFFFLHLLMVIRGLKSKNFIVFHPRWRGGRSSVLRILYKKIWRFANQTKSSVRSEKMRRAKGSGREEWNKTESLVASFPLDRFKKSTN